MRIAWDNEFDKYTITANSEATGYPATNINQDFTLATKSRTTDDTAEWWKIDAGSGNTIEMTCAAIGDGHNLTSGATIKFQGNATDSWGSPSVDETLTYAAGNIIKFFTGGSYRYWQFSIVDAANPDGYIEIPRIFGGTYLDLVNIWYREFPEEIISTSDKEYTVTGQLYGNKGVQQKIYNFQLPYLTNTQKESIETMFATVDLIKPVFLTIDENDLTKLEPIYAAINDDLSFNHIIAYVWNTTLSFKEAK